MTLKILFAAAFAALSPAVFSAETALTDGEVWNEGVGYYRDNDVTNALRVLRPLMLSKTHGARAAEVVAKLEHERGNREEAAGAAQIALRAAPDDAKANRNFTRATDGLLEERETKRINAILQASQGKDLGALMQGSAREARALMDAAAGFRTNAPAKAVSLADSLSRRADALADTWIPLREVIAQSVTNEEQAATIVAQISEAQAKTKAAAKAFGDLDGGAYGTMSGVEHDFTRFLKLTVLPPAAMDEDLVAQSNAWMAVDDFNGRNWQQDALDYTRAFRAKFPAWAQSYEAEAQSDTNKPPFTKEQQDKISALATELEKLQIGCAQKLLPPDQERALEIINQIKELLPKDNSSQQSQQSQSSQQSQPSQDQQQNQQQDQKQQAQDNKDRNQNESDQKQDQDPNRQQDQEDGEDQEEERDKGDPELEATLKKAQERNDEHEAEKKARMRKAPLPPNERDW